MDELLRDKLKQAGYSITKARLTVFSALQGSRPKTMHELVDELDQIIDRASVYRTVALFESIGVVKRVQHGWKYRVELSDEFAPHHHHLMCSKCKRVVNFDEPLGLETILDAIAANHGFIPRSHSLEIFGLCPSCATTEARQQQC